MGITCFLYLCLFCYSITFSILYHTYAAFVLAVLLGILPVIFALIGWIQHFFVCVNVREVMNIVEKGSYAQIIFEAVNRSFLPVSEVRIPFYYWDDSMKKKKDSIGIPLSGKQKDYAIFQIPTEYCGTIHISLRKFRCFDFWHLASFSSHFRSVRSGIWHKHPKQELVFYVVPQMKETELDASVMKVSLPSESECEIYSKTQKGDDPSEIFDIREYQPGDRIQRIHWKLSSKKDFLMVKDFSLPLDCHLWILVDHYTMKNGEEAAIWYDEMLERAISLSYSLTTEQILHNVAWYSEKTASLQYHQIANEDDLYEMLCELLSEQLTSRSLLPDAFHEHQNFSGRGELFYFGSEPEKITACGYQIVNMEVVASV